MRTLVALLLGGFGLGAFWRRRRRGAGPEASPADELKAKLAASRAAEAEPEPPTAEPPPPAGDVEARRREVHQRARGAIDDLR